MFTSLQSSSGTQTDHQRQWAGRWHRATHKGGSGSYCERLGLEVKLVKVSPFSFFPAVFQNSQTYQMPHGGSLALWSWLGSQWNHSSESKRQKRVHIKRVKLRRTLQGLHKERPQRVPPLSCGNPPHLKHFFPQSRTQYTQKAQCTASSGT